METLLIVRVTSTPQAILAWIKYLGQILLEHTFSLKHNLSPQSENIRKTQQALLELPMFDYGLYSVLFTLTLSWCFLIEKINNP